MEIGIGFALSAFVAGLITFLAPCTLPLVPAYLGFLAGVTPEDLADPLKAPAARRRVLARGVSFVLGFSIVFVAFGALAGAVGQVVAPWREILTQIAGVFIIVFGLVSLGVFNIPLLAQTRQVRVPKTLLEHPLGAFLAGSAFGVGWTPCIGPVLGSILFLASASATALTGALLLAIFSFGLAIPFVVVALLFSQSSKFVARVAHMRWIGTVSGVFLILLGVLLLTNQFGLLIHWGFEYLDFLNYEAILKLL